MSPRTGIQYSCELSFEPSRKASALSQRSFSSDFMLFCDMLFPLLLVKIYYNMCLCNFIDIIHGNSVRKGNQFICSYKKTKVKFFLFEFKKNY